MDNITKAQARRFLLLKHGLLGEYIFNGKEGVMDFIRQAGCVQFDPVDVCGRSVDIALHSRVSGYTKETLGDLLYKDRRLIDYFDKNLSIFAVEDLPAFRHKRLGGGYAEAYDARGGGAVEQLMPLIRRLIAERGYVSAAEVGVDKTIEWKWSVMTSLPRAALESMYFRGELIIHHKNGMNKSYALAEDYIPAEILGAAPPFVGEDERLAWHIKRRIGAVGLLWNRASDAWLGLKIKTADRKAAFRKLLDCGEIFGVTAEGIKDPLYIREDDRELLSKALPEGDFPPRCELIAPLDSLIWDRKLIKALFGFEYTWEIYTPAVKRKYGAYALPILLGEGFVGRAEAVNDRKAKSLAVKNIWFEPGFKPGRTEKKLIKGCFQRLAVLNGCESVDYERKFI